MVILRFRGCFFQQLLCYRKDASLLAQQRIARFTLSTEYQRARQIPSNIFEAMWYRTCAILFLFGRFLFLAKTSKRGFKCSVSSWKSYFSHPTTIMDLGFSISYASIALIYYDYALTLPLEIKHVWGRRLCLSTFLYTSCRYALLGNVLFLLASAGKLEQGIIGALSVLGRAAVIVTLTGRTSALYTMNRYVLVYLGALGTVCVGLDIAHIPTNTCDGDTGVAM
ncbi:hypothetical protein AB1N83_008896 [Pleurotus pulmonarius]